MLTLREVKQLIEIPEKGAGTPTARYMKDCGTVLLCRQMGDGAKLTVYREGYAAYEAGKHATVFPVDKCGDYDYGMPDGESRIRGEYFDSLAWYIRLFLEGEDRLCRNRESYEREKNVSYSMVSEEWSALEDLEEPVLERLIREEAAEDLLGEAASDYPPALLPEENPEGDLRGIWYYPGDGPGNPGRSSPAHTEETGDCRKRPPVWERDRFPCGVKGQKTETITYCAWAAGRWWRHQSRRREKYQEERNRKHGVCSLEQRMETGDFFPSARGGPEDAVIRRMCRDKLRDALAELSGPDIFLIRLLYFEEVSISEAARLCGCSRKTIRNRREKILAELNRRMSKSGVTDGNF